MFERLEDRLILTVNPIAAYPYVFPAGRLFHENAGDIATAAAANANGSLQAMLCRLAADPVAAESAVEYTDIRQGQVADCGFLAGLAEIALKDPQFIQQMFQVNGDGTLTVYFYLNGAREPVTITRDLPAADGYLYYDGTGLSVNDPGVVLWAAYAEKALAVWLNKWDSNPAGGQYVTADYNNDAGFLAYYSMQLVTNLQGGSWLNNMSNSALFQQDYAAGDLMAMTTPYGAPAEVVSDHVYAVISYDAATDTLTLFNPWGIQYGLTTMTFAHAGTSRDFDSFDAMD